jgi:hypothetical protein
VPEPQCPDGAPSFGVDAVTATPGPDEGEWTVTVEVIVDNRTDAAVDVTDLLVASGGAEGALSLDDAVVGPGEVGRFAVPVYEPVVAAEPPAEATARLTWHWLDFAACPAPPVEVNQPDAAAD